MSATEPLLELRGVSARWGRTEVVRSVSFTVGRGEVFSLLGPNGSGKSTLLRVIAGFERPTAGTVRLEGTDLEGVPPHRRSVGLLFQDPVLFPHRTVFENIAYAPLIQRRPAGEVRDRVREVAELLALGTFLDRLPDRLSGGEQQRVALARSLAARPKLVLLDEPFASLDVEVRAGLHAQFRAALARHGTAAIHVTHDREEGLFLGDRVGLLFAGCLEAIGTPEQVYARPTSEPMARFLGYNVLRSDGATEAVLPQDIRTGPSDPADPRAFVVRASGPVGRTYLAVLERSGGERVEVRSDRPLPVGSWVGLSWERSVPIDAGPGGPPAEPKNRPSVGSS